MNKFLDITNNLMMKLQEYDKCTYQHSLRVAELSLAVGKKMKLSECECNDLYIAGLLHDIGKIEIPSEIIQTERKLNFSEYELIKEHPLIGYNMIVNENFNENILNGVIAHHERLDGSGYPYQLLDRDISLYARIIGVTDSFDAMTSDRSYSKKIPIRDAINELNERNEMYDESIINILDKMCEEGDVYV